jgi:hypothetical protein
MVRQLTQEQIQRVRELIRRWEGVPAPCGISYADIYNPCLPEYDDDGWLVCVTCWRKQKPAITP